MLAIAETINEGWSYETQKDLELALRRYKMGYNNLLDLNSHINTSNISAIPIPGVCPYEIRSVSDYLNYRICLIQFELNNPREAITQFKKHVETFKQHTKAPEYAFEHAAWLSQQYLLFADLFSQAVANGVKASKSQQPGHYYYEGAMQMMIRRQNTTEFTNDQVRSQQMPITKEFLGLVHVSMFISFLHQCGWSCVEPINSVNGSHEIQSSTGPINYSESIIKSLHKAAESYHEWGRPRMRSFINVLLANEYKLSNDIQNSNTLYQGSLSLYTKERWSPLIKYIQDKLQEI